MVNSQLLIVYHYLIKGCPPKIEIISMSLMPSNSLSVQNWKLEIYNNKALVPNFLD